MGLISIHTTRKVVTICGKLSITMVKISIHTTRKVVTLILISNIIKMCIRDR